MEDAIFFFYGSITNHHTFSSLHQHKFIISRLMRIRPWAGWAGSSAQGVSGLKPKRLSARGWFHLECGVLFQAHCKSLLGAEAGPSRQPAGNWNRQSCNHQELNSANTLSKFGNSSFPSQTSVENCVPEKTLTQVLWDLQQRTQISCPRNCETINDSFNHYVYVNMLTCHKRWT